ncbi:MAG: hypothetical protein ACRDYY_10460 [Acidimicrobiales bacterium]
MIVVVLVEEDHARQHWRGPWHGLGHREGDHDWDDRSPGGCTHGIPPDVPATLDPRPLVTALTPILAGRPADGSTPAPIAAAKAAVLNKVVWVDAGDEIVAHLDSLTVKILDGAIVMSLDLEDDATGRAPVVVRFAVSSATDQAGLIAATDEVAGGNPTFAARWGKSVQDAAWGALLGLAQEHAAAHAQAPQGISAVAGALRLHLEAPVDLTQASAAAGSGATTAKTATAATDTSTTATPTTTAAQ